VVVLPLYGGLSRLSNELLSPNLSPRAPGHLCLPRWTQAGLPLNRKLMLVSNFDQSLAGRRVTCLSSAAKASALRGEVLRQASPISRLGSGAAKRSKRMSFR
jgi:hypothetical protein